MVRMAEFQDKGGIGYEDIFHETQCITSHIGFSNKCDGSNDPRYQCFR